MAIIQDLKTDEDGWFANGKFTSTSLFQGDMNVSIFIDDGATVEDAEKCISHYNAIKSKKALCNKLQEMLERFFLYMYEEWKAMGIYDDIIRDCESVMEDYKAGKNLIDRLTNPELCVYPQRGDEIGYGIQCECPWKPEHQCLIIIRNDEVLYAGPSDGLAAWGDDEDYYCIWNDEDVE
ncbi:DUF6985 domain-containing protein [Oscillospiraceae bacterium LCP25S3_E10]